MTSKFIKRLCAAFASAAVCVSMTCAQFPLHMAENSIVHAATSINDMPGEYQYAADWIWENRIVRENSLGSSGKRWNSMFDQLVDGKGTLNYVVRWHSTKTITLEQRRKLEDALDECLNAWTDWLVGYENWPYDHIDVNIVGWAVTDPSLLLDLQPDEIVYTDTVEYVIQPGESDQIPTVMANAPTEISRFDHFWDENYQYPGGLDKRFDQYVWATQGFPDYGGCGGDWGQRLSDNYYIGVAEGTSSKHVQIHEVGHCFGITDFYGGEGASDGFPPGGFPGGGTSIMMAGSSSVITDFDGWLLRYMWTKIKDESGRFDLANAQPETTEPSEDPTEPSTTVPTDVDMDVKIFTDTITAKTENSVTFEENGTFFFTEDHHGDDPAKNLANYEAGDTIEIEFAYYTYTSQIFDVARLTLIENIRDVKGDVNADGTFSIADIIMTQKWLLNAGEITDAAAGDLHEDGILDGYDLAVMKRMLLQKN